MTSGVSMHAMTRNVSPRTPRCSMSMRNTLLSRCIQLMGGGGARGSRGGWTNTVGDNVVAVFETRGENAGAALNAQVKGGFTVLHTAAALEHHAAVPFAEVTGAVWDEIDLAARTWTVPVERMKGKREHRVPLSGAALAILEVARERTGGKGLVFRSPTGKRIDRLVSVLRKAGIDADAHGFRSSLRDWCSETNVRTLSPSAASPTTKPTRPARRIIGRIASMPACPSWSGGGGS